MSYPHPIVSYDPEVDLEMLNNRIHRLQDGERLLIDGLPEEMYRAAVGHSTSDLKHAELSPAHWLAHKKKKREYKKAFEFGRAVHMAILEPMRIENDLAVMPDRDLRSNAGKEEYIGYLLGLIAERKNTEALDNWLAYKEANPKDNLSKQYKYLESIMPVTFVSEYEKSQCDHILAKVNKFSNEQELSWTNSEISGWIRIGDHILKGRADALNTETRELFDVKTARSIQRFAFIYDADKMKYNRQAYNYMKIFDCTTFKWIAVEKEFPYAIGPFQVHTGMEWIDEGEKVLIDTLNKLQHCIDTEVYTEPYDSFETIQPRRYERESFEPVDYNPFI